MVVAVTPEQAIEWLFWLFGQAIQWWFVFLIGFFLLIAFLTLVVGPFVSDDEEEKDEEDDEDDL